LDEVAVKPASSADIDRLIALWERVLRHAPIRHDDNFFDLGGDSLQAIALFLEIEQETGRALPITSIYDAPTPAALASLLADAGPVPFSPLVLLKAGAATAPLFIAHGLGGNVMELAPLAKRLDTPRPVYAIQPKGLDGAEAPYDRVADMADYYFGAVRALQPHGPYFLSGYSFGGLIAMELARRLKEAGEGIALLAFLDTYAHPHSFPLEWRIYVKIRAMMGYTRDLTTAPAEIAAAPALLRVYNATSDALLAYRPRRYSGKILFLKARRSLFPLNPRDIWRRLSQEYEMRIVPGNHDSMMREDVDSLAAELSRCLAQAGGE